MPVPNLASNPAYDGQSASDATDWDHFSRAFFLSGLISGCVVSALNTPAMEVQVSAGAVEVNGASVAVSAASVAVQPASASDRRDIVVVSNTGTVTVVEGTPCGTSNWTRNSFPALPPVKPAIPSSNVFLSDIYVAATTTSITSSNINNNTTRIFPTVQTFGGRSGSVTLAATDIESTFTTRGQLYVGTGSGTGELLATGSVGTVLTSNGAASIPSWQPATGGGGVASVTSATIEATFSAAGQIYQGTGVGTGQLLSVGSVGTILYSNGTTAAWQAASVGGNMNTAVYDPASISQQLVGTTATQTITNKRITKRVLSLSGASVTATPTFDTDNFDVIYLTGINTAITSMTSGVTGTPLNGDTLRISFTDAGSSESITWGTDWESSTNLPLPSSTLGSSIRMDCGFFWNPATSRWRLVAQS